MVVWASGRKTLKKRFLSVMAEEINVTVIQGKVKHAVACPADGTFLVLKQRVQVGPWRWRQAGLLLFFISLCTRTRA